MHSAYSDASSGSIQYCVPQIKGTSCLPNPKLQASKVSPEPDGFSITEADFKHDRLSKKNQRRVCTLFTQLSKNRRAQQNPTERSHATKNVYSLLCKPRPQIPHDLKNRVSVCLKTHHDLLLNPPNNTKLSGLFDLGVYQDNTHSNGGLTRF